MPRDWPKVDFFRETQGWPESNGQMTEWTSREHFDASTPDRYLGPGSQKLSCAALHYRLNCGFGFSKRIVVALSTSPDCFLAVIDHNKRRIMIFSAKYDELIAAIPMLCSCSVPACWLMPTIDGRIVTLDVDNVNLDLFGILLKCTGSLASKGQFTEVIGKSLCLSNLREFLAIKERFEIPASPIKRVFAAWQDQLDDKCPMDSTRDLLALWLHLGPVGRTRFDKLVEHLVFNSWKQVSTGPFPEETPHDDELVRRLTRRIDDIRRSLRESVIDYVLVERWDNVKRKMRSWEVPLQVAVTKGYEAAETAYNKAISTLADRDKSVNELLDQVEAIFKKYWGCKQALIDTKMTLSQYPWGFHGLCIDCLKRSLEQGVRNTDEQQIFWNIWTECESYSHGCSVKHGYTVFIDSFLGPSEKLRALLMEKWSNVEFSLERWQDSLKSLGDIERVFQLRERHLRNGERKEFDSFVEEFMHDFAEKHNFSIAHVRALFTSPSK